MALNLKDKHVLVTGSTDGLGKLLVFELAKLGANITIHGKKQDKLDQLLGKLKKINPSGQFNSLLCDLNNSKEITKHFSTIKDLDILINNAGIWCEGDSVDATPERIMELANVNLTACMLIAKTLIPTLLKSDFGQILNVVSVAGIEIPADYYHTYYTATKYGMQGFSEGLAREFANKNLRVMGFYPGGMSTSLFKNAGCLDYADKEDWMFDPMESVEAIIFMLTRNKKINVKRLDLINHLLM